MIDEKGLNHIKSLVGQPIGNFQCYALSAEYVGVMFGPGMGAMTNYPVTHQIGNIFSAALIADAYDWKLYSWKVVKNPDFSELKVGAVINWSRGAQVSDNWYASDTFGHTGVIKGLDNGRIQTYEQNAEAGEIIAEYDRGYYGNEMIASICIPPDFEEVT